MTQLHEGEDMVNHPTHYTHGGIECIEAIRASLGLEGFIAYCRGNIQKYLWRSDFKEGGAKRLQDMKKAAWYLNRAIEEIERAG